MTYKFNKSDNTVSPVKYIESVNYYKESTRITVSGNNHKWRDGYLVTEGVHFKIQRQVSDLIGWVNVDELTFNIAQQEHFKRIVAIPLPINEGKEQEENTVNNI